MIKDLYPLPQKENFLDYIGSAKYSISIILYNGYWQCGIAEKDILKEFFLIRYSLYKWVVMTIRLANAPSMFI